MGIIAVAANLVSFGLLLGVEALISRLGCIPSRGPSYRYFLDRDLFQIGDTVGLSAVAFAVGAVLEQTGFPPVWYVFSALAAALVVTGVMHIVWLRQPVRDSAYPLGGVSLLGILHLPYFAGHVAWILLGLWHVTDLSVLGFLIVGVLGGLVWLVTLVRDGQQNKEG